MILIKFILCHSKIYSSTSTFELVKKPTSIIHGRLLKINSDIDLFFLNQKFVFFPDIYVVLKLCTNTSYSDFTNAQIHGIILIPCRLDNIAKSFVVDNNITSVYHACLRHNKGGNCDPSL